MSDGGVFVDYYAVLRVDPKCSARKLETAYHLLAKLYHPDHGEHSDVAKLTEVIDAYKALRNPDDRQEYDARYASETGFDFAEDDDQTTDDGAPLSDAEAHARILQFLYKRRRENALEPGVGRYYIQEILNCPDDLFDFHLWYLKEKGLIGLTEEGTLAITIEGVDHVIATSRTAMKEKLMLSQAANEQDQRHG
ncbi:J domain-containing protein [Novosphingobium aquiterrae]|uniref:J domain-containing protein n=1 Tax=Novosphingobium aquiterrae TaxID=624388 RepID=A0ABV6PPC9_9SPHN